MALNAYAAFTANGVVLDGTTTVPEVGGIDVSSNHIECYSVSWGSRLNTGRTSGRRRNQVNKRPITLLKPIDNTTPLLYQAIATNQRIDGTIKIFSNDPNTGATLHVFTVTLEQARIVSVDSVLPNTLNEETASLPPSEQVELVAHTLTYTDEITGVEYQDQ